MVGSWSNRPRIGIDASTVLGKFFLDFGIQFCVAGAVFGEVGGMPVVPRIVNDVSNVTDITHESHFLWQAQYLVILQCHFSWQVQHLVKSG